MTLNDITRELFQDGYMGQLEYGPVQLDPYREEMIDKAKEAILSDLLEIIPKEVDTKKYKCDDSEYSFMLGYIQACIEIEEKVRKYCD